MPSINLAEPEDDYISVASSQSSVIEYIDEETEVGEQGVFEYIESSMAADARHFDDVMILPSGYSIALYGGRCVVVSLRRARERVLYEDMLKSLSVGSAPTQRMFFAEELTLSIDEYELMESHATEFSALGFEVEYRGDGHIAVNGRPALLDMTTPLDELIYELLHGIENGNMPLDEERNRLAQLMARRGSAGYGRNLRKEEAQELLKRLEQCDDVSFTPSGNPIMAELTAEEMAAKLMRC
jgi:DNA mismatch repair protein MutL